MVGAPQPEIGLARLEEDFRVVVGIAREVSVELQSVFQQRALHRLNLGNVLESLFADSSQHPVHGLAGFLQVGHGLKAAALCQVSLVFEADVGDHDDNRNCNGSGGGSAAKRGDRRMAAKPFARPLNRVGRSARIGSPARKRRRSSASSPAVA